MSVRADIIVAEILRCYEWTMDLEFEPGVGDSILCAYCLYISVFPSIRVPEMKQNVKGN